MHTDDCFGARANLSLESGSVAYYSLRRLDEQVGGDVQLADARRDHG